MIINFDNYSKKDEIDFAYRTMCKLKTLFPNMTIEQVAHLLKTLLLAATKVLKGEEHDKQILFYKRVTRHIDATKKRFEVRVIRSIHPLGADGLF